jgi:superfamily I DNA/RNA helicase
LQLLHNGDDEVALRRIINVPPRGIGPASLERLATFAKAQGLTLGQALGRAGQVPHLGPAAVSGAQTLTGLLAHARGQLHGDTGAVSQAVSQLFEALALKDAILSANDSPSVCQKRLENLSAAVGALERFERKHGGGGPVLAAFLRATALRHEQEEEQAQGEVTLMTLHAAKGLEFKYVFMVGAEEDFLPHRRALEETGSQAAHALAEERRLCYVGMTRAKARLFISYAKTRLRHGRHVERTPSRFLSELPEGPGVVTQNYGDEAQGPDDAARSEALAQAFFAKMRAQLGIDED